MASLYHRKLLEDFDLGDISTEIEKAIKYVNQQAPSIDIAVRDALVNRLRFRQMLLSAVQLDGLLDRQRAMLWEECLELLPMLSQTNKLGLPSEDSFGIKIQRKLASSVPPRPIIRSSFDEALARVNDICRNSRDAYRVLDTQTSTRLMVCDSDVLRLTENVLTCH